MVISARTDVGRRRTVNQDSILAKLPLAAVADGVGGASSGEVASATALQVLEDAVGTAVGGLDSDTAGIAAVEAERLLDDALVAANRAVHELANSTPDHAGMATTLTAVLMLDGREAAIGHVGDSRAYLVDSAGLVQLTDDHSVVGELVRLGELDEDDAEQHPRRNVITRAIGGEDDVEVDTRTVSIPSGSALLLCSDGLNVHLRHHDIAGVIARLGGDPEATVNALVDAANDAGGSDNISVIIVAPDGTVPIPPLRAEPPLPPILEDEPYRDALPPGTVASGRGSARDSRMLRMLIAALVFLVLALAAVIAWRQSFFLTERADGRIGIDRGFPLSGLHESWRTGEVTADELSAYDRRELIDAHQLRSRADAEKLLRQLPERIVATSPPTNTTTVATTTLSTTTTAKKPTAPPTSPAQPPQGRP